MPRGPSLPDVAAAKLREARRLVRLQRSFDAERVAEDAKVLFERCEDAGGVASAKYLLVEAALLEERIEEARQVATEELAAAEKAKDGLREVAMLRALLLVSLAEGKPLDALELAAKAEAVLLKAAAATPNPQAAGELLLQVAQSHMAQGTTAAQQAALNAALQAVDHFSRAAEGQAGPFEADAWRAVLNARVVLGKFEDGIRAAEAAMVICVDCGDEVGQALCLLNISQAHLARGLPLKAKKAAEKALGQFQEQNSDLLAAEALDVLIQALVGQEQRKDALQRAKQELSAFLSSGDKWATPRMRGCLVKALMNMDKKKEALAEAERALESAQSLKSLRAMNEAMKPVAILNIQLGKVDKAKDLADELLRMSKQLGDLDGEAVATQLICKAVQERGVFEEKAALEREAEDLIIELKKAMTDRDGPRFKEVLEKCYENENVFTEDVEEIIGPVILTDPDGLYEFFLNNQPEKWKIDRADDRKFDAAQQFDRRLLYYVFRLGAMGYGPGFRLVKTDFRLGEPGQSSKAVGTLNLMENCPDWEERTAWHPGLLDCVLQVGAARVMTNDLQYKAKIETEEHRTVAT
ncbi:unnamed protein product [Effrenium voratum]|uniref:Uncharacterized protein n=1 Tax=Effrenium voratum TaxID=2562239 RepID=A0AA36JQ49_9DINO|nr:unnamed protein product [Effrenium voratum]CAJ1437662.1 unnamed protein product [Effrenium voratum]